MNSSTIAIILGVAVTSGGIAYIISNNNTQPTPDPIQTTATPAPTNSQQSISTPSAPTTNSSKKSNSPTQSGKPSNSTSAKSSKPDGISDALWEKALERSEQFAQWANRARDSERYRERLERHVERDSKAIAERLGLPEESAGTIQAILTARIEKSIARANKAADTVINNPEAMATLVATRELQTSDAGISDELLAMRNATKDKLFGEFYKDGTTPDSIDIGDLLRPDRPKSWYKDNDFLVSASTEINSTEAANLMDYAGKLDYLDRQDNAFNRVNRLERTIDLSTQQSKALKELYTKNSSPSQEQIAQVIGHNKAQAVKQASDNRRRR